MIDPKAVTCAGRQRREIGVEQTYRALLRRQYPTQQRQQRAFAATARTVQKNPFLRSEGEVRNIYTRH
ncbi:hypothetical protein GCM10022212_35410 [Actimicrobium antarcticum]|uniref:Uncharacterized protein n=1 Tax=Actimicrobium antarcticum TaxID=1051899 RepID=A0ABP7TYU2_9BURK